MKTTTGAQPLSQAQDSGALTSFCDLQEITLTQAREAGLEFMKTGNRDVPTEAEVPCEFCGKPRTVTGIYLLGKAAGMRPKDCDCEQAAEHRAEQQRLEDEENERERRQKQLAWEQERINKLIGKSGIKKRFQQRTFGRFVTDTPERERSFRMAKNYADGFDTHLKSGTGLYIEGPCGTGKTHLAGAIAMQLLGKQRPVICKTSIDLLADIKNAFGSEREEKLLKAYSKAQLLVIDDLGKEQCTEWSASMLYSIINERYESMLPIIITTNFNEGQLKRRLSTGNDCTRAEAMLSRLHESTIAMPMNWEDWRGKHGA